MDQPGTGVPARAWLLKVETGPSDRQTSMPVDASRVCSREGPLVVVKISIQAGAERFRGAPPCTSKCKAPASRRMQIASQA